MAQYKIHDPEELIPCPYDKVHMIRAKRMQYHLMKCRKNYVGKDYANCPFNARHEMPRPELRYHMANCPDKAMIEPNLSYELSKMNGEGTMFKGYTDVPAYDKTWNVPQSENWEEEVPSVARIGVDPNFFARLTYKDMTGMTRQEKKLYREQMALPPEERKFVFGSQAQDEENEGEERRLRLPHQAPQAYMGGYRPQQKLQQPSQVFAYSMSMAGVGRGQTVADGSASQPLTNGAPAKFPGRGRGIGRGMPPPSMMIPGGINSTNASRNGAASEEDSSAGASGPITNGFIMHQTAGPTVNSLMMPQTAGQVVNGLMMPQATAAASPVFTMGVGRGRGMRIAAGIDKKPEPAFVVPNVNRSVTEVDSKESGTDSDEQGTGSPAMPPSASSNVVNVSEDVLEDAKSKNIKKLMKKLKQIEILEKKKSCGEELGSNEEMKIGKKDELTRQLQALRI